MNHKLEILLSHCQISYKQISGIQYEVFDNNKKALCSILNDEPYMASINRVLDTLYGITYDQLSEGMAKNYSDFPYYKYSDKELINDYKKLLAIEPKICPEQGPGNKIINYYHKSIFNTHKKGYRSCEEAWTENNIKRAISECLIINSHLSGQILLQSLIRNKTAQKVSTENALTCKYLINKYLSDEKVIFSPMSGYSGCMLGACSLGKKFLGTDINQNIILESKEIIDKFKLNAQVAQRDINLYNKSVKMPAMIVWVPDGLKETWGNDHQENLSCDEWINKCTEKCMCDNYLFIASNTNNFKDNIVEKLQLQYTFGTIEKNIILLHKN